MKNNQALFSSNEKSKILKCRLLQCLFGAFRVKYFFALANDKCNRIRLN